MKTIKIQGERNTGTNYLVKLIRTNLGAQVIDGIVPPLGVRIAKKIPLLDEERVFDRYFELTHSKNLGWKHAVAPNESAIAAFLKNNGPLLFVSLVKNPYAWLLSLARKPYHNYEKIGDSFLDFLQKEWRVVGRENAAGNYPNPIALWNDKNRSYLELSKSSADAHTFRYEELLVDPKTILQSIAKTAEIEWDHSSFHNVEGDVKKESKKDFSYYQNYYLDELWKDKLTSEEINYINQHLDLELVKALGYEIL